MLLEEKRGESSIYCRVPFEKPRRPLARNVPASPNSSGLPAGGHVAVLGCRSAGQASAICFPRYLERKQAHIGSKPPPHHQSGVTPNIHEGQINPFLEIRSCDTAAAVRNSSFRQRWVSLERSPQTHQKAPPVCSKGQGTVRWLHISRQMCICTSFPMCALAQLLHLILSPLLAWDNFTVIC